MSLMDRSQYEADPVKQLCRGIRRQLQSRHRSEFFYVLDVYPPVLLVHVYDARDAKEAGRPRDLGCCHHSCYL